MEVAWQKNYYSEGKTWKVGFKYDSFFRYLPFTSEKTNEVEEIVEIPLALDHNQFRSAIIRITDCPFKDMQGNFNYFTKIVNGACQIAVKLSGMY